VVFQPAASMPSYHLHTVRARFVGETGLRHGPPDHQKVLNLLRHALQGSGPKLNPDQRPSLLMIKRQIRRREHSNAVDVHPVQPLKVRPSCPRRFHHRTKAHALFKRLELMHPLLEMEGELWRRCLEVARFQSVAQSPFYSLFAKGFGPNGPHKAIFKIIGPSCSQGRDHSIVQRGSTLGSEPLPARRARARHQVRSVGAQPRTRAGVQQARTGLAPM